MEDFLLVRDRPRLDLDIDIETPSGRHVHWSGTEKNPANVPSGLGFKNTMPGGHSELDVTLPRKRGVSYSDVERLSTVTVYGPGGDIAWQGRLDRAPRSSGSQMSVSPGCVGYQAHLDDDQTAQPIYRDTDLSHWGPFSRQRRLNLITAGFGCHEAETQPDSTTGEPSIKTGWSGPWTATTARPISQAWYESQATIGSVYYEWEKAAVINSGDTNWTWVLRLNPDDVQSSPESNSGNLRAAGPGAGTVTSTDSTQRFATVELSYANVTAGGNGIDYGIYWSHLAVYGNHGLTKRGTEPDSGFYPSDIIAHAVSTWAPQLNYTTGTDGSIQTDTFVIPHLAFTEPTTAAEIVRQATRFGLQDWAVWDNKTFYWAPRGTFGRSWRARASEADLSETGDDTARLFNGVLVQFQDVDGSTKTAGPPGSGADTTSSSLADSDTENPATKLGINRWTKLSMGVSTAAGATEVGRRFLEETKQLDHSGQARIIGHCLDDKGVLHPAWRMRAGDTISFTDASDTSERRIVSCSYDHDSRTMQLDLDAPPDSMSALLERLDVVIAPLGL